MKKKTPQHQKVVIPKGMINPTETTIIEIPLFLQKQPVLIAKKKAEKDSPSITTPSQSFTKPLATSSPLRSIDKTDSSLSLSDDDLTMIPKSETDVLNTGYVEVDDDDLETTELNEKKILEQRLQDFQRARRKLLEKAPQVLSDEDDSVSNWCSSELPTVIEKCPWAKLSARSAISQPTKTTSIGTKPIMCVRDIQNPPTELKSTKDAASDFREPKITMCPRDQKSRQGHWLANCASSCENPAPPPTRTQCCSSTNTKPLIAIPPDTCDAPQCKTLKKLATQLASSTKRMCKETKNTKDCHSYLPFDFT